MDKFQLEMRDISIEFPGVKALKGANFKTSGGVVHALVGANGAGKSTLMKVLSGAYSHWEGTILINGEESNIRTVRDSKDSGIEIVYQEVDVALIPYLSVAENIMLDQMVMDYDGKQIVNWMDVRRKAGDVLKNERAYPVTPMLSLSIAQKQMFNARALSRDCRLLILDEPTAPLSQAETEELFKVVKDLKDAGVGVVFITHRLPEIFQICDEITVMRDGRFITNMKVQDTTEKEVIEYMLGRSFEEIFPKCSAEIGEVCFEAKNLSDDRMVRDVSIYVRKGEIVGIAGLVGAGKTELCKAIFGAAPLKAGEIFLNGKKL